MTADPAGPDDRLNALEDRVTALEYYRDHQAPQSMQAAGLGLEIVRQEARDLSIKLTRVIQRQDQDGATLRDVVAVQQEQGELLERIGRVLGQHGRQLDDLAESQRVLTEGQGELRTSAAEILRRLPSPESQ